MQDIIRSINQAEANAAEIKCEAQKKAAVLAENAEERSSEIAKLSEAECKAYRENCIKSAEREAQEKYDAQITAKRAEASKYAAECLADADGIVEEIVRRITRGNC